jgi:hypothetical protein
MADRGDDPGLGHRRDQVDGAGEFGGQGDDAQPPAGHGEQAIEGGDVGRDHVPRILGAAPGRGEERPLQVEAGDDALAGQAGQHRGPGLQIGQAAR